MNILILNLLQLTKMNNLSTDLLLFIQNKLNNKNDKLNITRINKNISKQLVNNIKTKISIIDKLLTDINFKYKLNEYFNTNLCLCINSQCINKYNKTPFDKMILGRICFYYPINLTINHDFINHPNEPNIEKIKRYRQCKSGPYVCRMIPYCYNCTSKYVNYGKINDNEYSVPFSTKYNEYFF